MFRVQGVLAEPRKEVPQRQEPECVCGSIFLICFPPTQLNLWATIMIEGMLAMHTVTGK